MFDVKLQAFSFDVTVDEEQGQLEIVSTVGFLMPVSPTQLAPIAIGVVRQPIAKETALQYSDELREAAEKCPDPPKQSNIEVASSLQGVEEAMKVEKNLRG